MSREDWRVASALFSLAVLVFVLWVAWNAPQPAHHTPTCHGYHKISAHAQCEYGHDPGQRNHWSIVYG